MWAFALWDARNQVLFCARDRLGEKPFFYAERSGAFMFGSEIKALFAAGQPREVNEEMLDAILCFGYLPAPYTTYRGCVSSPPGASWSRRQDVSTCAVTGRCRRFPPRRCAPTRRASMRSSQSCSPTACDCECAATFQSAPS